WLTLEVTQPQATRLGSEAEHRVAWQQFPLPAPLALADAGGDPAPGDPPWFRSGAPRRLATVSPARPA
ncbi:hypothetical protein C3E93_28665, partial [Klebsiella pneumoniae]